MDELKPQESEALDIMESLLDVADMKVTGPIYADDPPRSGMCRIPEEDAAKLRQYIADRRTALESKSLTVGDHIRSMTDKELAELLNHAENAGYADESIAPKGENNFPIDMLDWLRQPYVRKPKGSAQDA